MANPEHLEILKQGVEVWNRWRKEHWYERIEPDLSAADLNGLDLTNVNLLDSNLSGAVLNRTNLFRAGLIEVNLNQASLIEADLRETYLEKANLQGANLFRAKLANANLYRATLDSANLAEVSIERTSFLGANLSNSDMTKAKFYSTDLSAANLKGVNFQEATLWRVNLSGANLEETIFTETEMIFSVIADVNFGTAYALDTIQHLGPSYIDIQTLYLSRGSIPEIFLRGCGLSDIQIEVAKLHNPILSQDQITEITKKIQNTLVGGVVGYHSSYISYASEDQVFAEKIYNDFQEKGVRCWFYPEDMRIGDKIRSTIDRSIQSHDKVLLILSEYSINSNWVEKEVETALEEENKRNQTVLFPIRLDQAIIETNQAWAADIRRTRNIGDFTRWKDQGAYQAAFERLLRDLKAES